MAAGVLHADRAWAADPEIHLAWEEGVAPVPNVDYLVSTNSPASPEYPDVKLITGSLTWKIWSTDTDNPNNIGDIGVITSPYAENFAVRIEDDQAGPGARHVKGIVLDPTGATNHSSIAAGQITGDLEDEVFLQRYDSGEVGGTVAMEIGGDVVGTMALPWVNELTVGGSVSGSIEVLRIDNGNLEIAGDVEGSVYVGAATNTWFVTAENVVYGGTLEFDVYLFGNGHVRLYGDLGGTLTLL